MTERFDFRRSRSNSLPSSKTADFIKIAAGKDTKDDVDTRNLRRAQSHDDMRELKTGSSTDPSHLDHIAEPSKGLVLQLEQGLGFDTLRQRKRLSGEAKKANPETWNREAWTRESFVGKIRQEIKGRCEELHEYVDHLYHLGFANKRQRDKFHREIDDLQALHWYLEAKGENPSGKQWIERLKQDRDQLASFLRNMDSRNLEPAQKNALRVKFDTIDYLYHQADDLVGRGQLREGGQKFEECEDQFKKFAANLEWYVNMQDNRTGGERIQQAIFEIEDYGTNIRKIRDDNGDKITPEQKEVLTKTITRLTEQFNVATSLWEQADFKGADKEFQECLNKTREMDELLRWYLIPNNSQPSGKELIPLRVSNVRKYGRCLSKALKEADIDEQEKGNLKTRLDKVRDLFQQTEDAIRSSDNIIEIIKESQKLEEYDPDTS